MKPLAIIWIIGASALLGGCPPPQFPRWRDTTGGDRNENQWEQDYSACQTSNPVPLNATTDEKHVLIPKFFGCMTAKGWEVRSQKSN